MDISKFYALKERLYYSAASGTSSLSEDFRLKRAVDEFEAESAGSKAFARLSAMCRKLLSECSPSLLADCIALADAMTVVQGTFSDNTETEKSSFINEKNTVVNIPYSEINTYREFVKSGCQTIEDAICNLKGGDINSDPRIISAFIVSLKKSSLPSSAQVLRYYYGKEIAPLVKNVIDLNDPKAKGHIVSFIRQISGADENEWYISLYENADNPPEIRAAAVRALSCDINNTERLINIYKTEKVKLKNASLYALGELDPPEADEIWRKLADNYKDSSEKYFIESKSRICTEYIRNNIDSAIYNYKKSDDSIKSRRIFTLRYMLANKADTDDIYSMLAEVGFSEDDLNNLLIANLANENNDAYKKQISRLFSQSSYFRRAWVVSNIIDDPDRFFPELSERIVSAYSIELNIIKCIQWCAALGRYVLCFTIRKLSKMIFVPLTESFPQCMLDFITDKKIFKEFEDIERIRRMPFGQLLAEKKIGGKDLLINFYRNTYDISQTICYILMHLHRNCSPDDKERIRRAAVEFAEYTSKLCPDYSNIRILTENKDISSPHVFAGLLERHTAYILEYMDRTVYSAYANTVNLFPMTNEEKISELEKALKTADKICTDKNNKLYEFISRDINQYLNNLKNQTGV